MSYEFEMKGMLVKRAFFKSVDVSLLKDIFVDQSVLVHIRVKFPDTGRKVYFMTACVTTLLPMQSSKPKYIEVLVA